MLLPFLAASLIIQRERMKVDAADINFVTLSSYGMRTKEESVRKVLQLVFAITYTQLDLSLVFRSLVTSAVCLFLVIFSVCSFLTLLFEFLHYVNKP